MTRVGVIGVRSIPAGGISRLPVLSSYARPLGCTNSLEACSVRVDEKSAHWMLWNRRGDPMGGLQLPLEMHQPAAGQDGVIDHRDDHRK